ncbi:hypothetical protein [Anaerorhabdus sp.]|jgi:hypothetical protein|uniref:hypothetical protein n=1 Tax=Anaerorhabdus sp. TaxID=1872524 RepID=UPI002FC9C1F9
MKKILLLILALSLVGCTPSDSKPEETTPKYELTDEQNEQLDLLLKSGGYFDDFTDSLDTMSYNIENDTVIVQLNGPHKININFKVGDVSTYTFDFSDVVFNYSEDNQAKTAILNSTYTRTPEYSDNKIESSLGMSDKIYNIIFNQSNYVIENNGTADVDEGAITFNETLDTQLFDTYINQWNILTQFDSNIQILNKQITQIFTNFDAYSLQRNSSDNSVPVEVVNQDPVTTYEFTDFPYSANNHNYLYYYSFNGEPKKTINEASAYDRTLFLFFFLTSRDSFSIAELSSAFLTVDSQYYCYGGFCSTLKEDVNQGVFREHEFSLMTLDYFNQCIKDVFNLKPYNSLDKYEYLDTGVYVSGTDNTLMADFLSGPWDVHYHGANIEQTNKAGTEYISFTPYIAQYGDCSGNECTYDLYTTEGNIVKGGIPESKVNDYVVENKERFFTWNISLAPGSNPYFYQVLSYELE